MILQCIIVLFFIVAFIPYLVVASIFVWKEFIYPFWRDVLDRVRGSLGSVKK